MNYKYRFSIFTATFNRGKMLSKLYECILSQDYSGPFEWIIVSDGSTDETSDIVKGFICDDKIPIKFIEKINEGKHTAWRAATPLFEGRYIITADDDDPILPSTLSVFDKAWSALEKSDAYDAFWEVKARCVYEDGKLVGCPLPEPFYDSDYISLHYYQNKGAEMHGCRKVEVLRNEASVPSSFVFESNASNYPEGLRWAKAARKYKTRFIPDITRVYIVGHDSLCVTKKGEAMSDRKLYNILVSAIYNLIELRDILLKSNRRLYRKNIYSLLMASIRLRVFTQAFGYVPSFIDRILLLALYPFVYMKCINNRL